MAENKDNRFKVLLILLTYMIVGCAIYLNTLDNSFHFDDKYVIVENRGLAHLEQLPSVFWGMEQAGSESDRGYHRAHYRPIVYASYMINYAISGLNPRGYHVVNLLIHIITAFLVALVMDRLTGRLVVGALSGLLFLVHPFNAEAVNYVTARSSQLYAMFYLLSFYAYMRYRPPLPEIPLNPPLPPFSKGGMGGFERGYRGGYLWLGLSILSFVLSMLSKELAVTLPLTILLYEWLSGSATRWQDNIRRLLPPVGIGLVVVFSYMAIRKVLVKVTLTSSIGQDIMNQLATQSVVLVRTLELILWPVNLTIDHRVEVYKTFVAWPVLLACLVIAIILGLALWWGRSVNIRERVYAFLLLWFFVILSPLMLIQLNAMLQENRAYLAVVGMVGLMAILFGWLLDWARSHRSTILKGVWMGIVALVLLYATLTFQRNKVWKDDLTLWMDAIRNNPGSSGAHLALGIAYHQQKNLQLAIKEYQEALILKPDEYRALGNLAQVYRQQGRYDLAIKEYQRVLQLVPSEPEAHYGLGLTFQMAGQMNLAMKEYQTVLVLNPNHEEAILRLKNIHAAQVNPDNINTETQRH